MKFTPNRRGLAQIRYSPGAEQIVSDAGMQVAREVGAVIGPENVDTYLGGAERARFYVRDIRPYGLRAEVLHGTLAKALRQARV